MTRPLVKKASSKRSKRSKSSSPLLPSGLVIERWPIDELVDDPDNARLHGQRNHDAIVASLKLAGQVEPLVIQKSTGRIIGGHGRKSAMLELGWTECDIVRIDVDDAMADAIGLALNRTSELASWSNEKLSAKLSSLSSLGFKIGIVGFTDEEVKGLSSLNGADLSGGPASDDPGAQLDKAAALRKKWKTARGQLWIAGEHRILCGDSTVAADVERVMGGEKADLCFTSPPYAQQRDYESGIGDWNELMLGVFGNLPMADAGQVLVNLGLVHRDGELMPYWDAWIACINEHGWRRFGWYVWDQGPGIPGAQNGRLASSHEFIFHFNRDAVGPLKARKNKQAGEIKNGGGQRNPDGSFDRYNNAGLPIQERAIHDSVIRVNRQGSAAGAEGFPAPFPVDLAKTIIESWPGLVYEPFAGSGTTIVAAEQTGRRCFGIEIEPKYVAVILERLSGMGLKPELEKP